jgi:CRISPR-associated protein Cas2
VRVFQVIVIVAYDIREEERRRELRNYLRRVGMSRVNRSVYAGPGTATTTKLIVEKAKEITEEGDSVFIIVVREDEYQRAHVFDGRNYYVVKEKIYEVY